jgi:hypothetical protein
MNHVPRSQLTYYLLNPGVCTLPFTCVVILSIWLQHTPSFLHSGHLWHLVSTTMLNFHLEVAAAKAAVERKDVITAGSAGRHAPSNPSSSRAFTSAFPHDNEEGKKKAVVSTASSSKAIKITQFVLGDIHWDTKDKEDSLIDEQTTIIRAQVLNTVNNCLAKQNTPSTILCYEATSTRKWAMLKTRWTLYFFHW